MISFSASCSAILPLAGETKVVSALSTDVVVAEMTVEEFRVGERFAAVDPKTDQGRLLGGRRGWGWLLFRGGLGCGVFELCRLRGRRGGGCCGHGCGDDGGRGTKEGGGRGQRKGELFFDLLEMFLVFI